MIFKMINILMVFILPISLYAQSIKLEFIDSLSNKPIENVYAFDNRNKLHCISDEIGICSIMKKQLDSVEKIMISHVGFVPKHINVKLLSKNKYLKVLLNPKIFELKEVIVSPINPVHIINQAIERIDENYLTLTKDTLYLNVDFTFLDNPTNRIAEFKGGIAITKKENKYLVAKYNTLTEIIDDSFYNYGVEVSPNGFYKILSIKNHAVIQQPKKYEFSYEGITEYQGKDMYKISFIRERKCLGQKGYMLINTENYAITYMIYKIEECEKWIAATQKGIGLFFTNLNQYKVQISYLKENEKYRFSRGSINMSFNRSKKKKTLSQNTYNLTVKKKKKTPSINKINFIEANELFTNKKTE